jgi:hypothetical protein
MILYHILLKISDEFHYEYNDYTRLYRNLLCEFCPPLIRIMSEELFISDVILYNYQAT